MKVKAKDYAKALEWFEKAANQGYASSQFNVGIFYNNGLEGVKIDKDKAFKYFKLSADQGFAKAQYDVGIYYIDTDNPTEAFKYFKASI